MMTVHPGQLAGMIEQRAPGFEAAFRAAATETAGKFSIPRAQFLEITQAYLRLPPSATPPPSRGLGDLVALFAEPIARASDAVLGTHLVGCGSCAERRAALNKLVPKL